MPLCCCVNVKQICVKFEGGANGGGWRQARQRVMLVLHAQRAVDGGCVRPLAFVCVCSFEAETCAGCVWCSMLDGRPADRSRGSGAARSSVYDHQFVVMRRRKIDVCEWKGAQPASTAHWFVDHHHTHPIQLVGGWKGVGERDISGCGFKC